MQLYQTSLIGEQLKRADIMLMLKLFRQIENQKCF